MLALRRLGDARLRRGLRDPLRARAVAGVDRVHAEVRRRDEGAGAAGCCIARDRANLTGLVLGCIEAKFCK